ncbi:MAG: hypothetical protein AAF512_14585, partial [Pseudomonadota bacterium]
MSISEVMMFYRSNKSVFRRLLNFLGFIFLYQSLGSSLLWAIPPDAPHPLALANTAEQLILSPLNNADLADQAEQTPGALTFAKSREVEINTLTHGTWTALDDGRMLWRFSLQSPGAYSLNLGFDHYHMPEDGALFIYSPDGAEVIGPFTSEDNESHGQLWTPLIKGDALVIEINIPTTATNELMLSLKRVGHDFRNYFKLEKSGSCHADVACEEGNEWRNEIRAVGSMVINGAAQCSGVLLNNTSQDRTPYFLSANHCGVTVDNAPSVLVFWNYEN